MLGLLAGLVAWRWAAWQAAVLIGWDVAAVSFSAWVLLAVAGLGAEGARLLATREDSSRAAADLILLAASVTCLVGVALALVEAAGSKGLAKGLLVALAVGSVVVSWTVVHIVFMLRYARLYYSAEPGGIDFGGETAPDYADFAYISFTIGMTFQVSDTDLTSRVMRAAALRQALLSYLFGAVIVGMTINVVAGLLK